MTLQRANPLPVGDYWIDVFGDNRARAIATWLPLVQVRSTESYDTDPPRDWVLFHVATPLAWDAVTFGFPTIADSSVQTSDDTVTKPPPEPDLLDTLDPVGSLSGALRTAAVVVGGGIAVAGVLWLFRGGK